MTYDIIVKDTAPSEQGVQNYLFTEYNNGTFKLELLTQQTTGDLKYCLIPLNTVIAPTPTEFPTPIPLPPQCTVEVIPKNQIIRALEDVTVGIFSNDRNFLLNMQLFQ